MTCGKTLLVGYQADILSAGGVTTFNGRNGDVILTAEDVAGVLPIATTTSLGAVVVGSGLGVTPEGVLSLALPIASSTLLGGVKIGTGLLIDSNGVLSTVYTGNPFIVSAPGDNVLLDFNAGNVFLDLNDEVTPIDPTTLMDFGLLVGTNPVLAPDDTLLVDGGVLSGVAPNIIVMGETGNASIDFNIVIYNEDAFLDFGILVSKRLGEYELPTSGTDTLGGVTIPPVEISGLVNRDGIVTLAVASPTQLGGVRVGPGLAIDPNGVLKTKESLVPGRNRFINGGFTVNQRKNTSLSSSYKYSVDRWQVKVTGTVAAGTVTTVKDVGFESGHALMVNGSWSTGNLCLKQIIEDVNSACLANFRGVGPEARVNAKMSLKVLQTSNTLQKLKINIYYPLVPGGLNVLITTIDDIDIPPGNVIHVTKDIEIPQIAKNGCIVEFILTTAANDSSVVYKFSDIQLESGDNATPFEVRQYSDELALCKRYYQEYKCGVSPEPELFYVRSSGKTNVKFGMAQIFPVEMRVAPTAQSKLSGTGLTGSFWETDNATAPITATSETGFSIMSTVQASPANTLDVSDAAAGRAISCGFWPSNNNDAIMFDAEL